MKASRAAARMSKPGLKGKAAAARAGLMGREEGVLEEVALLLLAEVLDAEVIVLLAAVVVVLEEEVVLAEKEDVTVLLVVRMLTVSVVAVPLVSVPMIAGRGEAFGTCGAGTARTGPTTKIEEIKTSVGVNALKLGILS
jgi:hypothetical protein